MLLLDQNLSPKLTGALRDCFADPIHVQEIGLGEAEDDVIWNYAVEHGRVIVTKDADFRQRSFLEGHPPKIIWIALGNCSTAAIEHLLRSRKRETDSFLSDERSSFFSLS
ncbi:MAG: DUF5615 family PIN-like protein [Acidobacteriaceae bacterium]